MGAVAASQRSLTRLIPSMACSTVTGAVPGGTGGSESIHVAGSASPPAPPMALPGVRGGVRERGRMLPNMAPSLPNMVPLGERVREGGRVLPNALLILATSPGARGEPRAAAAALAAGEGR